MPIIISQTPSLSDLKNTFKFIKDKSVKNIPGIIEYDTNIDGPTLGITMCTHGDEPAGLAILWYFNKYNFWEELKCGKVIFVLQNILATERYFSDFTSPDRNKHRYADINFNRLPENALEIKNSNDYEINRLQELYPIYKSFTHGFDIHTSQDEVPMIITGDKFYPELVRGFPIEVVLTNISKPQIGFPSFEFFGGLGNNIPVFEIEAGTDESPKAFETSIVCALSLLKNLGMLEGGTIVAVNAYKEYFIYGSVIFPNDTFKLSKVFEYYESLEKRQELAKGTVNEKEVILKCEENGHAIFPPLNELSRPPQFIEEEQMFLSLPVKRIEI